ncbi:MAG: phosphate propanoyltransferase [Armatimonadetes bacterium]|jgi:putative phosphotransacetylase|nr:phosphate propanoyltransferase [Armatimonadota bacterium]
MDEQELIRAITTEVLRRLGGGAAPAAKIPVGVSARHCHLCPEHVTALFGPGQELTPRAPLYQPGQFAAEQTVTLVGPRGILERVRVLGPTRPRSQVEVALTDAIRLGVRPSISDGSDLTGTAPIVLVGPAGVVHLHEGLILAWRHIHLSPREAEYWGVKHHDVVRVELPGPRGLTLNNVLVRVSPDFIAQMHIDTDEANAAGITCDLEVEIAR